MALRRTARRDAAVAPVRRRLAPFRRERLEGAGGGRESLGRCDRDSGTRPGNRSLVLHFSGHGPLVDGLFLVSSCPKFGFFAKDKSEEGTFGEKCLRSFYFRGWANTYKKKKSNKQ